MWSKFEVIFIPYGFCNLIHGSDSGSVLDPRSDLVLWIVDGMSYMFTFELLASGSQMQMDNCHHHLRGPLSVLFAGFKVLREGTESPRGHHSMT